MLEMRTIYAEMAHQAHPAKHDNKVDLTKLKSLWINTGIIFKHDQKKNILIHLNIYF